MILLMQLQRKAMNPVGEELGTSLSWRPVLDEDYIQSKNFREWTNDVPVMVGSVFGENELLDRSGSK